MNRLLAMMVGLLASDMAIAEPPRTETAILAGGCFWGMEAVFEHVKGVRNVESGYAGGSAKDANYNSVSSERTRHAEAIRIRFDPRQISYAKLLHIYFTVAHDPTQLNRQGPDTGASYRSAIFPQDARQQRIAGHLIAQLRSPKRSIATRIEYGSFFPAEGYHQDFVKKNLAHPYVVAHDRPKLANLKRSYPQYWKQ